MATKIGSNVGLLAHAAPGDAHYNELTKLFRWLDFYMAPVVISRTLTVAPTSPVDGATYIVAAAPTGTWVGRAGNIARWTTDLAVPAWEYMVPKVGHGLVYNLADGIRYQYVGTSWVAYVP